MDAFVEYTPIEVDENSLPEVSMDEVALHNTQDDLWIVINGKAYDVSQWKDDHPGGDDVLLQNGGKDVSELFRNVGHSPDALAIRRNFMVGLVKRHNKSRI